MPDVSGVTVVTNARVYYSTRAAAGASSARHSLLPSWGSTAPSDFRRRNMMAKTRAKPAARSRSYIRRHCERSEAIHSFFVQQAGLLRFARNDVEGVRRVGKGALAPCPPKFMVALSWWARFALPTLHSSLRSQ